MNNLSVYAEAIDKDEPITIEGFTLYPILMSDYRRFMAARSVLLIRQGSLPAEYAVMRYLNALYAMDYDAVKETGKPAGFIAGALEMLAMAMRFPVSAFVRRTMIRTSPQDGRRLEALDIRAGEAILHLTPAVFDRLRPIIAEQNGLELPDESENADLVEAEEDIAAANALTAATAYDINAELAAVARDQRIRRAELMDYTIKEYTELKAAIERDKLFTIYKTAELSGTVKFTKGNPVPSWCYDRREKANSMIPMAQFMAEHGSVAKMT